MQRFAGKANLRAPLSTFLFNGRKLGCYIREAREIAGTRAQNAESRYSGLEFDHFLNRHEKIVTNPSN
jgi:hypothetical protein